MTLDIKSLVRLIEKVLREQSIEYAYRIYLVDRPYLDNETTFNDYLSELDSSEVNNGIDYRTTDEIMEDILLLEREVNNGTV